MTFRVGGHSFDRSHTWIMGVVNVTPDSFSDGGQFSSAEAAVEHALSLVADGAHILDIGGESTRPGADSVSADQELDRVLPVISALAKETTIPISIDTTKAIVAQQACAAGATMVNDISGLTFDTQMASVVADLGVALCVMHIQGKPKTMQARPEYVDVFDDVSAFLSQAVQTAEAAGVSSEKIIIDPGIGFGKRLEHNLQLIQDCGRLEKDVGKPVLMGVSRKSFIGTLTGRPVEDRLLGTAAAVTACVLNDARIVRVHDVRAMRDVVVVADALR